jgi:cell division protease FtsH
MVTEWGMSEKVGPISYGSDKEFFIGRDMQSHVTYSDKTAAIIDEEIRRIVDDGLQKARKLLAENKSLLDNMARLLVERETIFTEEVDMLMEGKSVEEIMAFMDENERTLQENPFARKTKKNPVIVPESEKIEMPEQKAEQKAEEKVEKEAEQPNSKDQEEQ